MSAVRPKDIFLDAIDLPPDQREAYVRNACGGDTRLWEEVQALINRHGGAGGFLAKPARVGADDSRPAAAAAAEAKINGTLAPGATIAPASRDEAPGDVIDRYELVRPLGEGGFGVVFLANQREPVQRQVAVKIIKRGMDSRQIVRRFEAERQTLAVMDHPGIARVYDAGTTRSGRPYFVMEYVAGAPITEFADRQKLGIRQRLELMEKVCLAVQHAHTKGIIHRDLKPHNILVTELDGHPEPKVIDFGVAKAADASSAPAVTQELQIIGTPQYMSPEQATTGGSRNIDTRSDVYSLGTILYELVAGAPPFNPEALRKLGIDELCRIIREQTPPRPSTRVADVAPSLHMIASRGAEPSALRRQINGEVDWIVMKALEKEPARRYQSAAEMAADLRRHLNNEAVLASPPSRTYLLRKLAWKYRLQILAALIVLLALFGAAVVGAVMATRARLAEATALENARQAAANAHKAELELARARAIADFTQELLNGVAPSVARGRDTTLLREILDRAVIEAPKKLAGAPTIDLAVRQMIAQALYDLGDSPAALKVLQPAFEATRDVPDRDELDRLRAAVTIGTLMGTSRRLEEAQQIIHEALEQYLKSSGGREDEHTAAARTAMAGFMLRQGNADEAKPLLEQVVEWYRRNDLLEHDHALGARNSLAVTLHALNQPEEAVAIWREVLEVHERKHGLDHPDTLATMNNLAATVHEMKRFDEAEALYREMIAQERKIYDRGHPQLVKSLSNYGAFLLARDRVSEAAELLEEAEAMSTLKLEDSHSFRIALAVQMIKLRDKQGRHEEAADRGARLYDKYVEWFGRNDRRTTAMISVRLASLAGAKRFEEGTRLIETTPPESLEALPDEVRQAYHASAGKFFLAAGDLDRAIEQAKTARKFVETDSRGRQRVGVTLLALEKELADRGHPTAPTTQPATTRAGT